jgi:hypothetical protein
MKNKIIFFLFCAIVAAPLAGSLWAQGIQDNTDNRLPLGRVVILASGLAYYEYSGSLSGSANISFPFRLNAVNDALKTLIINDPASRNPSVTYQSENTLILTLRSLSIDLSDMPDMAVILSRLRGAEVEITDSQSRHTGRIVSIENRHVTGINFTVFNEPHLLLNTTGGIRSFYLKDINVVRFLDTDIERDLNRALDLIAASRNTLSRHLLVNLPGTGRRNVSISYVIPSPVWKVTYRLDLGAARPLFQGWAIVDNDSDTDWNNVELSLVAGRPTSFIQELYPPYYVFRPVLPLSIAGTAGAVVHERGAPAPAAMDRPLAANDARTRQALQFDMAEAEESARDSLATTSNLLAGGALQTAAGTAAGGQFEFTIRNPVNLDRSKSAMFPLVESQIEARKTLIYGGSGRHPRLGAELTNTTGMKLPAGPITVYDRVYAGDALIEFWNENEKRLISYGEDLSVTASTGNTNTQTVSSVNVSGGVMSINRHMTFIRTYTFNNSSADSKQLVVEHPRTAQTELVSPNAAEQTPAIYRFNLTLPANQETVLTVSERRPLSERITLLPLRLETLISYTTNQEIPANVRAALQRAVELRRAVDAADSAARDIEVQRDRLIADQDRTRRNLEAVGNQTQQGQEFLRRLVSLDSDIDELTSSLERARANVRSARTAFENYLNTLNL